MTTNHDPILSRLDQIRHWITTGELDSTSAQYKSMMDALAHTANAPRPNCTTDRCPRASDVYDEDSYGSPPLCAACWMARHGQEVLP